MKFRWSYVTAFAVILITAGYYWVEGRSHRHAGVNEPTISENSAHPHLAPPSSRISSAGISHRTLASAPAANQEMRLQLAAERMKELSLLAERKAQIERLRNPHGKRFVQNAHEYEEIPHLWALPQRKFDGVGSTLKPLVSQYGFVYFSTEEGAAPPAGAFPAVYSPKTGLLAAVTGGIAVQLKSDETLPQPLAQDFKIEFVEAFEDLKLAYFRASAAEIDPLMHLVSQLKKDSRVADVKIQLLEIPNAHR